MKSVATDKQAIWAERVQAWRASGQSARRFSESSGCGLSSLRYWANRLKKDDAPRMLRLVPKATGVEAVPTPPSAASQLTVEVGAARVVVQSGFDRRLLADVVGVLSGGGQ